MAFPDDLTNYVDGTTTITAARLNALEKALVGPTVYNVMGYGALGDGTTDDSTAIQTAIDAAATAGGGLVLLPPGRTYRGNITLKSGVTLSSGLTQYGYTPGSTVAATLLAAGAGVVIDTPVTQAYTCGIQGINVRGLGAGTAVTGIRYRDVAWGAIRGVQVSNCSDEGIKLDSTSLACVIEDVLAFGCVLDRSQAAVIGAVDVDGTDHYLSRIEAGISGQTEGTVQSASLYCVGIAVRMSSGQLTQCIGEISDIGIYVSGALNRFTGCRADLNYGHGWQILGASNQFTACLGLNNSQDTTNTYDNWNATSASGTNVFAGCLASSGSAAIKARYGFEDAVSSAASKNHYSGCISVDAATAQYHSAASNGSAFDFPRASDKTLTVNSATPDVTGAEGFVTANTTTTTITDFSGGISGQRLSIYCNDSNTTVQHNGTTITMPFAGSLKLVSGRVYEFYRTGAGWRYVWREPTQVGADVGNAAKTLVAGQSESTQRWATALTADRAVTLSTTGAYSGARFRIVRTAAATGAFNLNVGTGPLKALAAGEWCDVEFDGTNWLLTAAGSL